MENPLDRPIAPTVLLMVANQELVREHRCCDLSRIVDQSAMPAGQRNLHSYLTRLDIEGGLG